MNIDKQLLLDLYSDLPRFNTIKEVLFAVEVLDLKVYWSNTSYEVIKDSKGQWLINHIYSGSCVGLFWQDGITTSYKASDFFTTKG